MTLRMTVENAVQAKEAIERMEAQGYSRDHIHVFAHDKNREENINDALDTESVGVGEEGLFSSMKNVVSSRGDELRSELAAVGLTEDEAAEYEEELDQGKLVIIANKD